MPIFLANSGSKKIFSIFIEDRNIMKSRTAKNPLPQVEETDLSIFDRFKVDNSNYKMDWDINWNSSKTQGTNDGDWLKPFDI